MFQKGSKAQGVFSLIEGLLLFTAGILALIFCDNRDAYSTALIAVGIVIITFAAINLLSDLIVTLIHPINAAVMTKQDSIGTYALELALGVALIIGGVTFNNQGYGGDILRVFNFAALFVGLLLIILGGVFAIYATAWVIRAPKNFKSSAIIPYIIAVLTITFGVLTLVLIWNSGDDAIMRFLFIFAGIFLLLIGFFRAIGGIFLIIRGGKEETVEYIDNEPSEEDSSDENKGE